MPNVEPVSTSDTIDPIPVDSATNEQTANGHADPEPGLQNPELLGLRIGGRQPWYKRIRKSISLSHLAGSSSMIWFCPAFVIDWGVALAAVIIAKLYLGPIKPFHRDLSIYYGDQNYHWPLRNEQVPDHWLGHFSVTLPLVLLIFLTLISHPTGGVYFLPTLHHSLLGLLTSHALAIIPTDLLKIWVGALRPDFFSRCSYSKTTHHCTPHPHSSSLMENGMKSFPSGHSATAFAGLGFLSLWIAGRNGGFAIGGDGLRSSGPLQSRLLKASVALAWLFIALWIASTRIQDHRHHPRDVICGSLIGILSALVSYFIYFPSPFNGQLLRTSMGKPRLIYNYEFINLDEPGPGALPETESLIVEVDPHTDNRET
ncbi:phosphatidic acid phosphatase type 2/haloperoxidase [Phakopsora pachyrhizi]|uniref:Phosphatidic acid phosphatase type 2/haloperoxidase n=1 Tax=Phakopsora pachyrhizi TaxID=170000 RepID=A0AAV0ANX5_PHAPC|nr:phosphatidic acid phosphatase type 2/haloperoxidase [Phakopsora pachyrhizi]KAI8447000.1 phosphatidic acid phosphatase type 2/haloperoxidase [Phakopsora pachyrhizi]CAH7669437.1 phosphatidic acid phosphatase type 2/haloperoxidase [Phakopsora pachyrhizi]